MRMWKEGVLQVETGHILKIIKLLDRSGGCVWMGIRELRWGELVLGR